METHIHLGDKSYSISEFKDKLEHAGTNFQNWSGARKVSLGNGQDGEFRYNEILDAVHNAVKEQRELGESFDSNDDINAIYLRLQQIKNEGHESTGVIYRLFRRALPNVFRESKLNEIRSELEQEFPTTNQLKEHIKNDKDQEVNLAKKVQDGSLNTKLTIYEAASMANYLSNKAPPASSQEWYKFWSSLQPSVARNVFKGLPEEKLSKALEGLLPHKENITPSEFERTIGDHFSKKEDFLVLYSVYQAMTDLQREQHFLGLKLILTDNKNLMITSDSISGSDLFDRFALKEEKQDVIRSRRNAIPQALAKAQDSRAVAEIISDKTSYIQNTILGFHHGTNLEEAKKNGFTEAAIKEAQFVVKTLKDEVTPEIYEEYVTKYLQNPREAPVIQIGQAAILLDYLVSKKPPATQAEWRNFWLHMRPDIVGIPFILIHEKEWPNILQMMQLPELKKAKGIEGLMALHSNGVPNPKTGALEPSTPYLHKLNSIYAMMTDEQRTSYFEGLQLRQRQGSIQMSLDGENWI